MINSEIKKVGSGNPVPVGTKRKFTDVTPLSSSKLPLTMDNVILRLEKKYARNETLKSDLTQKEWAIERLLLSFGATPEDISNMRGKNILELGGGRRDLYGWEPWIARFFHFAGANVLEVDKLAQMREKFKSMKLDLATPGKLDCLPSNHFHYAVSFNLIAFAGDKFQEETSANLLYKLTHNELLAMQKELLGQVKRVLINGGIFASGTYPPLRFLRKDNDQFTDISKKGDQLHVKYYSNLRN